MISLMVAVSLNGVIGDNNTIPWKLKEDLQRFKELTTGHTIIMGRKTFESLPKVLPNRKHIVITRDEDYCVHDENVIVCNDIQSIIDTYKDSKEEVFIIGGSEIYNKFKEPACKVYLTLIHKDFEGDTYFNYIETLMDYDVEKSSEILNNGEFEYRFIDFIR